MKHLAIGLAGLLLMALNIIYFYAHENTAINGNAVVQSVDCVTMGQVDCTHDCSTCGRCFPISNNKTLETSYSVTEVATYKLIVK
ncbi:MAG: hypothetical protein PHY03_03735 [Dehalococcoidia bacterium]|nr:hypothetical protein [Dehalococcoidia bacterium]